MLSPRLRLIADKVKGKKVADIGTDHAYIPIELSEKNICEKIIATDIKKGPADTAVRHINKKGIYNIEVRVGNGLTPIKPSEVDEIIIAGMGGKLISDILAENREIAKSVRLILQPMNAQYELRKFLLDNGYQISEEDLTVEGFKVYNLLISEKTDKPYIYEEEIDYHLPKQLYKNEYFGKLLDKKIREFSKILEGNRKSKTGIDEESIGYYSEMLQKANELKGGKL